MDHYHSISDSDNSRIVEVTVMMHNGIPIIITTKTVQNRKHKKRRINKKWLRRYGYTEQDIQPEGSAYMFEGKLYMTKRDFERLKEEIGNNGFWRGDKERAKEKAYDG